MVLWFRFFIFTVFSFFDFFYHLFKYEQLFCENFFDKFFSETKKSRYNLFLRKTFFEQILSLSKFFV
jgi:hypothetical protein